MEERCMKVTIGVVVYEDEVRKWLRSIGVYKDMIDNEDYIEYTENKYNNGYGAEAIIL